MNEILIILLIACVIVSCLSISVKWYRMKTFQSVLADLVILILIIVGMCDCLLSYRKSAVIENELYVILFVLILVILAALILSIWRENLTRRSTVSQSSIQESVDKIDTGLCVAQIDGTPVLVNRRMQQLSLSLFSKRISNANVFWDELRADEKRRIVFTDDDPTFMFEDGSVWSFFQSTISDGINEYLELIAQDVTELFLNSENLKNENEQLEEVEKRLSYTLGNIAQIGQEEELISYKMRIHDELGNSILTASRNLQEGNLSEEQRKELIDGWEKTLNELKSNVTAGENTGETDIEDIKKTAKTLGCTLEIRGERPKRSDVLGMAIREAMYNAIKYAGADKIFVEGQLMADGYHIRIYDNTITYIGVLKEGGGISTLRKNIEAIGGSLSLVFGKNLEYHIVIPQNK